MGKQNQFKKLYVKLVDIITRVTEYDKKEEIFKNGLDNLYPDRVERFIANSVTAVTASRLFQRTLKGGGYEGITDFIIYPDENLKFYDFLDDIAESLTNHKGFYVLVKYNASLEPRYFKVLPFTTCRIGKKDDKGYNGKIKYKQSWDETEEKYPEICYDVFNPNKNVVEEQIRTAGGFNKFRGQVYFYNSERKNIYPTSRVDAVLNDVDSEHQSSIYKNRLLRRGFFGKTIFMTRPLVDPNIEEWIDDDELVPQRKRINPLYTEAVSEADQVRAQIQEFLGAENADGVLHMEADFDGDKMEEYFATKNIEGTIDPELFINVEKSLRENILIAYNNLPVGLVVAENSLFAGGGEQLRAMQAQFYDNLALERSIFVREVNYLISKNPSIEGKFSIINPNQNQNGNTTE